MFKVALGQQDASLYFFPYGPKGRYFYGDQSMPEHEMQQTFLYLDQFKSDKIPKLSIHESGQVHVHSCRGALAGPINTIPLKKWRGEHIATVTADSLDPLTKYTKEVKTRGTEIDVIVPFDDEFKSGRIAVYCNGESSRFNYQCPIKVEMRRPSTREPIRVGFAPIPQPPSGGTANCGVTVIAGWNPRKGLEEEQDFLYIRAL